MIIYLSLLGGLAALLVSGDLLVRGAVGIATKLGIPQIVIGLTIVALGTSAPELVISSKAALSDAAGLAVGNVVGSNIANSTIVLGAPALIAAAAAYEKGARKSATFMLVITLVFIGFCLTGTLEKWMGFVLLALLALFLYGSFREARRASHGDDAGATPQTEEVEGVPERLPVAIAFLVAGLIGLTAG